MKQYRVFFIFAAFMLLVSLACGALSSPDPTPVPPPTKSAPPEEQPDAPADPSNNQGSSDIITVEDQNKLYSFDIPANWTYEANDLGNAIYSDVYMFAETSTAEDGSTRFDWESKGGDYSGISWFEVRGTRTFLMWTVNWGNGADQATLDLVDNAINTYQAQAQ